MLTLNAFGGLIRRRFQVVDLFREDSGFATRSSITMRSECLRETIKTRVVDGLNG